VRVLDDVVPAVARIVRVVGEQVIGEVLRIRENLADRRLDRRQLSAGALLVAKDIEEDARDLVLGALVEARGQRPIAGLDAAVSSVPSQPLNTGRKTSSRLLGTSRQRVGRFSYMVIA
jgi:hypothetical protein